jgi:hypothetical protein
MWFTMERIGRSHGVVDGSSSGPVLVVLVLIVWWYLRLRVLSILVPGTEKKRKNEGRTWSKCPMSERVMTLSTVSEWSSRSSPQTPGGRCRLLRGGLLGSV